MFHNAIPYHLRYQHTLFTLTHVLIWHFTTHACHMMSALHHNLGIMIPTHSSTLVKRSQVVPQSPPLFYVFGSLWGVMTFLWPPVIALSNGIPTVLLSMKFFSFTPLLSWAVLTLLMNNHHHVFFPPSMRGLGDLIKYFSVAEETWSPGVSCLSVCLLRSFFPALAKLVSFLADFIAY